MLGEIGPKVGEIVSEVTEKNEIENFKEIKPIEKEMSIEKVDSFWNKVFCEFDNASVEKSDIPNKILEDYNIEKSLEKTLDNYFRDLKDKSEYPETLPDKPFSVSELEKQSPEKNAEMRDEFDDKKAELKKQWEEKNGMSWPKYAHDIYSVNGKLIRKAGSDYDAHHIQPLGMGGKNEVNNITPLNAEVHYDKQGVHSPDAPYSKLDKMLGGMD